MAQIRRTPTRPRHLLLLLLSFGLVLAGPGWADDKQRAMMTVVGATANADGKSQIDSQIIEECVQSLPTASELEPVVNAKSKYLKMINGDINDNNTTPIETASRDNNSNNNTNSNSNNNTNSNNKSNNNNNNGKPNNNGEPETAGNRQQQQWQPQ